jgi:ribosomal protein S18 acetylase RimI-like enzyme
VAAARPRGQGAGAAAVSGLERRDDHVAGVQESTVAGGLLVLARDAASGEPAGGGQCTAPHAGASELTSIGVRPGFRRCGIGAALTAWLAERMQARGADLVYLTAAGEPEARVYAGVGFERIGEALYVSLPDQG